VLKEFEREKTRHGWGAPPETPMREVRAPGWGLHAVSRMAAAPSAHVGKPSWAAAHFAEGMSIKFV
jgi:hypothetical protein